MAFEDRCSPSQANSPGPHPDKTPSSHTSHASPNPNDRSLKPYTCSIITPKYERPKSPLYKKNNIPNPFDVYKDNLLYHQYYNGFVPRYDYGLSVYDPFVQNQKMLQARHVEMLNPEEESPNLNFSISNILRPEFGLNAIKKTTYKKEGPKSGGPTQSILYKPYELAKTSADPKASKDPFKFAPLGKLCHAVASIPQMVARPLKENVSSEPSRTQNHDFSFSSSKHELHRRPDSANSSISTASSSVSSQGAVQGAGGYATGSDDGASSTKTASSAANQGEKQWPAWVYCTRYSDRPSSGPRCRRAKKKKNPEEVAAVPVEDKRPRTAFSGSQLARLKREFTENRYLTERRRQALSAELGLNEAQIKIWFQNKRAKIKKSTGQKNPLALQLMAQGLYNHTTASGSEDEEEIKVT